VKSNLWCLKRRKGEDVKQGSIRQMGGEKIRVGFFVWVRGKRRGNVVEGKAIKAGVPCNLERKEKKKRHKLHKWNKDKSLDQPKKGKGVVAGKKRRTASMRIGKEARVCQGGGGRSHNNSYHLRIRGEEGGRSKRFARRGDYSKGRVGKKKEGRKLPYAGEGKPTWDGIQKGKKRRNVALILGREKREKKEDRELEEEVLFGYRAMRGKIGARMLLGKREKREGRKRVFVSARTRLEKTVKLFSPFRKGGRRKKSKHVLSGK